MKSKKTIIVDSASNGVRLDKFLKERLNIPFSLLHKELRKKSIEVNNKKKLGSYRVKQDDIVDVFKEFKLIQKNKPLIKIPNICLLYTSPSPRDGLLSRMPSSA